MTLPAILRQKAELEKRRARLNGYSALFDTASAERALQRINGDVQAVPPLIERSQTALRTLQSALKELRMRRARTAIALAGLSIRALVTTLRARA